MALIDIKNLCINLRTEIGWVKICEGLDLSINEGEILGLVGSSGSGKSIIAKALIGMYDSSINVSFDSYRFADTELINLTPRERQKFIGENIALILQEAKLSLDPSLPIITQMKKALPNRLFEGPWYKFFFWKKRAVNNLLHKVGIKDTKKIMRAYPNELSDVLCQKIIIAIAFGRKPKLIIADDPISSMTSVSELQILRLISSFNKNNKATFLFITNNMSSSANLMTRINMFYCGQIVEEGPTEQIIKKPKHPFTESMVNAIPDPNHKLCHKAKLSVLAGDAPECTNVPIGCRLGPRCPYADKKCNIMPQLTKLKNSSYRCHFPLNMEDNND